MNFIGRTTQGLIRDDFAFNLQRSTTKMQNIQKQLSSGMRVSLPSDDTANTVNFMKWDSKTKLIQRYNETIGTYKDKMNIIDGQLNGATETLQRFRELTVQAANGTFTKEDRVAMAKEMDQLIRTLASSANAEYKGMPLFGGTSGQTQPYRLSENFTEGMNVPFVSKVDYFGNGQERVMDIGRGDRVTSTVPGTAIFETTKTTIQGTRDVTGYVAPNDASITIEGTEVRILSGDNLQTIAQKINDANLTVNASVEVNAQGQSLFRITSTAPREPWLQDTAGGAVLQDLGILSPGIEAPNNYAVAATVQKNSIFDTLIQVRDNLINDDVLKIGGESLGRLDQSMGSILRTRAYTGALTERLEQTFARNETEAIYLQNSASNSVYTDYSKTITALKMAEFAHQIGLNMGAKIIPPTLMDFIR